MPSMCKALIADNALVLMEIIKQAKHEKLDSLGKVEYYKKRNNKEFRFIPIHG